jgi:DNA-binding transcriptional LysR family regulator
MCNIVQMQWDDLKFVLALSRAQTLSGAAAALGATHTTVGRRLRSLEGDLGVRLFEQTPRGFVPTEAGADVLSVAERAEADLLAMQARVSGGDARLSGPLRVTTMDMLFRMYAAAFRSFAERHPGIDLTLHFSDDRASLNRREVDVALRLSNAPGDALVGRRVGRLQFAVYGSRDLVAQVGSDALADYPWVGWHEQTLRAWLEGWLAANAPGAVVRARVDKTGQLADVIAAGLGVHFLSLAEGDAHPQLVRIGPVVGGFEQDVWLLTLPELRHQGRVRAFMDHLYEAAGGG